MAKNKKTRIQYTKGVWSNGKKTIDLDNLNTTAEIKAIKECCFGGRPSGEEWYYVTEKGTIIRKTKYSELDDYYADLGPIYSRKSNYRILGRNFKQIKAQGDFNKEWLSFNEAFNQK